MNVFKLTLVVFLSCSSLLFSSKIYANDEAWWEIILRVAGISIIPATKGINGKKKGKLYIADISGENIKVISKDKKYYSPIFSKDGNSIFVLDKDKNSLVVFNISFGIEDPIILFPVDKIDKLLGIDSRDNDKILVLNTDNTVGFLCVRTGKFELLPYKKIQKNKEMISSLKGWTRQYDNYILYTYIKSKEVFSGEIEWNTIYLQVNDNVPRDITHCYKKNCEQPSLSPNKKYVVFIKSEI